MKTLSAKKITQKNDFRWRLGNFLTASRINMSKREVENKDSLTNVETKPPKTLVLEKSTDPVTEKSTETTEDFFNLEAKQYGLLHKTAENLEISDLIIENEGDQTEGFGDRIKELVENIYEEIQENFEQGNGGKGLFVKAVIIIF